MHICTQLGMVIAWLLCLATSSVKGIVPTVTDRPASETIEPPIFPDVFHLEYVFSMPHFYLTQPNGLSYPVSVWYDGPNNRRRVEAYDGEDSCVSVAGFDYTVIPRINELYCDVYGEEGRQIHSPLPDLYLWEYGGSVDLSPGRPARIWQRQFRDSNKVSQYTFYVSPEGVPLRLNMIGVNYLTNAHFDEYIYDFTRFQVGLPNDTAADLFAVPHICEGALHKYQQEQQQGEQEQKMSSEVSDGEVEGMRRPTGGRPHPGAMQLGALLPDIQAYDHNRAYNLWSRAHGRVHADTGDYDARLERFRSTVEKIQEHNSRPDRTYSMRLNHWADWHEGEFVQTLLPNKVTKQASRGGTARGAGDGSDEGRNTLLSELPGPYRPLGRVGATLERKDLPTAVDWRGTGADPGVKDQGMCGSCYSFAATGAMDGAWFVATGQRRSFSEQQIVDCAWDYGPNGCFGGYYQPVFNYIAENGGIALEQDYAYRGEVGYCRSANHSLVGHFSGYWAVESRNELALMEAVWKYGPVAVSVDASSDNFRFYSEGVYQEPSCSARQADLDHTVTLFGYGTTGDGIDFWLVRNSWAKYYGDDGYIRIVRGQGDCGIATDAAIPVVSDRYVVPEAQAAARRAAAHWA